jgi:alkyl hydroperoxide reductase subunit AhpC
MFGLKPYNYERFTRDLLVKDLAKSKMAGAGPAPGSRAPDFTGRTLEGDKITLSDFFGDKNVVLTFGSATCPMTAGSIAGMNELYDEFAGADVEFLFCYVREAHPGDELPAHESIDDKVRAAELLREEEDIEMPIIVDELNGSIHRKYGKLPNATFIIDKSGRIAFKCLWTQAGVVRNALEELLAVQEERDVEHAVVADGEHTAMPLKHSFLHSRRALARGGDDAVSDFTEATGWPGRIALVTSRVAEPVIENPGAVIAAALTAGAVIAGALYAGRLLREQRFTRRTPYDVPRRLPPTGTGGDYEAVGI